MHETMPLLRLALPREAVCYNSNRLLFSLFINTIIPCNQDIVEVGRVWGQTNNVTDYQRACNNRLCLLKKVIVTRYTGAIW